MEQTPNTVSFAIPLFAALMLGLSAVWLFYGWRLYRLFTTLLMAMAAAMTGWYFVSPHFGMDVQYLPPLLLGLAGGVVAIPLQRVAAFVLDGALGALVAMGIAVGFCHVPIEGGSPQLIAIAAAGFLLVGIPAAVFFQFLKVLSTAGYGAFLAIVGTAAVVHAFVDEPPTIGTGLVVGSLAVWAILTTVGAIFQWRSLIIHKSQTGA